MGEYIIYSLVATLIMARIPLTVVCSLRGGGRSHWTDTPPDHYICQYPAAVEQLTVNIPLRGGHSQSTDSLSYALLLFARKAE